MKRWCVFLYTKHTDKVEEYIIYLLERIRENAERVCAVCDADQPESVKTQLGQYVDKLIAVGERALERPGYSEGIRYFLDVEENFECEELLLVNDGIFGPLDSFVPMLEEMEKRPCDFWGLIKNMRQEDSVCRCSLSAEFMAFRGRMLRGEDFTVFWNNSDVEDEGQNVTEYFERRGYVSDGYIVSSADYDLCEYKSYELIKDMGCPVLFKKRFCAQANMNDNLEKALRYIGKNCSYPMDMIWEDVLNTVNLADLKRNLNLNFILSSQREADVRDRETVYKKTAVAAHIYYPDRVEICMSYLIQTPAPIDLYLTTGNEVTFEALKVYKSKQSQWRDRQNIYISLIPNRGRDMGALWVADRKLFYEYEYVCYVHDKKTSGNLGTEMSGDMYQYDVLENCLKNRDYIDNVLALFEDNPIIGFLCPPSPKFFDYVNLMGNEWTECFERTMELAAKLHLNIVADEKKHPFTFSNTFWCRTAALKPLADSEFRYEDFPQEPLPRDGSVSHALERIYGYVAQSQGYLSAVVENRDYAQMENNSLQFLLGERVQWNIVEAGRREKQEADNEILRSQMLKQGADNEILRGQIVKQETDNDVLREYIVGLEKVNADAHGRVIKLEDDDKILRGHINRLETDGDTLRKYIEDLENANRDVLDKLKVFEEDDRILRGHIERLEGDGKILRNYIVSLEERLAEKDGRICILKLIKFALSCKKVYIYGAGKIGTEVAGILQEYSVPFEGFLVSDAASASTDGICPRFCYRETHVEEEDGIIIALNEKHMAEVIPTLGRVKKIFKYMEEKKGETSK